jgi:ribosome-associated heat shock protein Hsp15
VAAAARSRRCEDVVVTSTRIDRWLHAVRLAPSRSAATEACSSGRVRVDGAVVKPSSQVRVGCRVELRVRGHVRRVEVVRVTDRRVGAPIAVECYHEVAPEDPAEGALVADDVAAVGRRERGSGRPTKRERRELDRLRGRRR